MIVENYKKLVPADWTGNHFFPMLSAMVTVPAGKRPRMGAGARYTRKAFVRRDTETTRPRTRLSIFFVRLLRGNLIEMM